MEDQVHMRVSEEVFQIEAPDVAFDESSPLREAVPLARRKVVEDDDAPPVGEKGVREMGADETGAAGHEDGTRLGHHAAEDSVPSLRPLPTSFYRRDTAVVARELLGCRLIRRFPGGERRAVVIVETEAYLGAKDRAAHTWNGRRTPRVAPMWGPGGHAYVYFVYGMHFCLNVVTGREGVPEAVLLRAGVPEEESSLLLASGPAKLCAYLEITAALSGVSLSGPDLLISRGPRARFDVLVGPRVGVDYAGDAAAWPLRFAVAGCRAVTRRALLVAP
jgi:DNA-3-methyladenine glycosylase